MVMTKTFIISGSNWIAEVDIENSEDLTQDQIHLEACTRAVEQHFGKRKDIRYKKFDKILLTEKEKQEDQLHAALVELITTELEEGCGIGSILCIMDNGDPDTFIEGEDYEWYVNSKKILENAGIPNLVEVFNKKYPEKKSKKN